MTRRSNNPFYINDETQEIVCVDIRYRVKLKKLTRSGMSVGFLIREAIHRFLKEAKEN